MVVPDRDSIHFHENHILHIIFGIWTITMTTNNRYRHIVTGMDSLAINYHKVSIYKKQIF